MDFTKIKSSYVAAGVPNSHYNSHLFNFEDKYQRHNKNFYVQLVGLATMLFELKTEQAPRYVFLCGCPGSGKTHFMVGLYRAMVQLIGYSQGEGALFIPFSALAAELITYFEEKIPLRTALKGYCQAKYLFFDDFTSSERISKEGSLEFNTFRDILIERYETESTLIASSNWNESELLPELDRLFGGYVTSRLSDSIIIQFPNVDFRQVRR